MIDSGVLIVSAAVTLAVVYLIWSAYSTLSSTKLKVSLEDSFSPAVEGLDDPQRWEGLRGDMLSKALTELRTAHQQTVTLMDIIRQVTEMEKTKTPYHKDNLRMVFTSLRIIHECGMVHWDTEEAKKLLLDEEEDEEEVDEYDWDEESGWEEGEIEEEEEEIDKDLPPRHPNTPQACYWSNKPPHPKGGQW